MKSIRRVIWACCLLLSCTKTYLDNRTKGLKFWKRGSVGIQQEGIGLFNLLYNNDMKSFEKALTSDNINNKQKGDTLLMYAAASGNERACKLLLKKGAKADESGNDKTMPLMVARSVKIAKMLLKAGANIDDKDSRGNNVVMLAAFHGHLDVCKLFIEENELDVNKENSDGLTALILARDKETIEYLIEKSDLKRRSSKGDTLLMRAAGYGNIKLCQILIQKGLEIEEENSEGKTALFFAKDNSVRKLLIDKYI